MKCGIPHNQPAIRALPVISPQAVEKSQGKLRPQRWGGRGGPPYTKDYCADGVTKLASPLTLSTIDAYAKIGLPERKNTELVPVSPVIPLNMPFAPASGA